MASDVFGIVGTTVVGAFHVEAVVAEGGFAVVYKAYHAGFRAPVALKCLKIPQYLGAEQQERFEEQFQAEAELLFKLSASIPTIVRPLHVEAVIAPDGSFMPFLALEWLDGETLDALLIRRRKSAQPKFSLEEMIGLLDPVARALDRAHHFIGEDGPVSIVHRDVKPENVFLANVAGEQVVKILDFGIAKAKSVASHAAGRASQGGSGVTSFTPAYGAPEQWTPKRYGQTGAWTDVWGLAVTAVELLAGRLVIDGDQAAMMGTALDPVRRPTPRNEGVVVSDAVEAVFLRALAVDPRERWIDAGSFWNALLAAIGEKPAVSAGSSARMRAVGRSGFYAAAASGGSPATERREPIPDLVAPRSGAAALEIDLAEETARVEAETSATAARSLTPSGAAPGAGSGQWSPSPPASPPPRPAPHPTGASGQWSAVAGSAAGSMPASSGARTAPVRSSSPPRESRPSLRPVRLPIDVPPESTEIIRRFAVPVALVGAGILITIIDEAYASANGQVFTLGPLHLAWLAAVALLIGLGLAVYRLLARNQP